MTESKDSIPDDDVVPLKRASRLPTTDLSRLRGLDASSRTEIELGIWRGWYLENETKDWSLVKLTRGWKRQCIFLNGLCLAKEQKPQASSLAEVKVQFHDVSSSEPIHMKARIVVVYMVLSALQLLTNTGSDKAALSCARECLAVGEFYVKSIKALWRGGRPELELLELDDDFLDIGLGFLRARIQDLALHLAFPDQSKAALSADPGFLSALVKPLANYQTARQKLNHFEARTQFPYSFSAPRTMCRAAAPRQKWTPENWVHWFVRTDDAIMTGSAVGAQTRHDEAYQRRMRYALAVQKLLETLRERELLLRAIFYLGLARWHYEQFRSHLSPSNVVHGLLCYRRGCRVLVALYARQGSKPTRLTETWIGACMHEYKQWSEHNQQYLFEVVNESSSDLELTQGADPWSVELSLIKDEPLASKIQLA